jgi:hypothetical protein
MPHYNKGKVVLCICSQTFLVLLIQIWFYEKVIVEIFDNLVRHTRKVFTTLIEDTVRALSILLAYISQYLIGFPQNICLFFVNTHI